MSRPLTSAVVMDEITLINITRDVNGDFLPPATSYVLHYAPDLKDQAKAIMKPPEGNRPLRGVTESTIRAQETDYPTGSWRIEATR